MWPSALGHDFSRLRRFVLQAVDGSSRIEKAAAFPSSRKINAPNRLLLLNTSYCFGRLVFVQTPMPKSSKGLLSTEDPLPSVRIQLRISLSIKVISATSISNR